MQMIFTVYMVGESTRFFTNVITSQTPYGNFDLSERWIRGVCILNEQVATDAPTN